MALQKEISCLSRLAFINMTAIFLFILKSLGMLFKSKNYFIKSLDIWHTECRLIKNHSIFYGTKTMFLEIILFLKGIVRTGLGIYRKLCSYS